MRTKSMVAAALTVVLTVGLAGVASQTAAAAAEQDVQPTAPPEMSPVPGTEVPVEPPVPDPAAIAAALPVAEPAWPEAGAVTAATSGGTAVRAQVLSRTEAAAAGVDGLLVRVGGMSRLPAGEEVKLSVDYSSLRNLYGGDWASRLQLVDLADGTVLPSANDVADGTLATTVDSGTMGSTFAVTADTGGSTGDFKATTLSPAGEWAVNAQSGAFTWSYDLRVPPVPGTLAPPMTLSYSSADVDGRTASTNNQPSWVGEGWSFWPGSIERSYRTCADVEGKPDTGDQCWITENAVMSLGGTTVELVREGTSRRWRPRADDGTRVEQRFDLANGDVRGEHWVATTTDGVQYHFGTRPEAQSTWTMPVFGDGPGKGCGGAFATSDCVRAWRWNLDYVVDSHGNTINYQYRTETNRYARNQTDASVVSYTRGGWLERIDYGGRAGEPAAAQVVFEAADRCRPGANCAQHNGTTWPDVPWDRECNGATCPDQHSPTFWSTKRLAKVTTRIWSGTDYIDVDRWIFDHSYPLPGDGTSPALWLHGITHTGLVGGSQALPPVTFAGTPLENRVDTPTDGPPQMFKYRIETIHNGSGGDVNVEYVPTNCTRAALPSPATNTLRCFPARWVMEPEPVPRDDWFHVYVVNRVTLNDRVAGGAMEVFSYDYLGGGAWRYDDNPVTAEKYRTWSLWRGYEKVQVRHGDPVQDPGRPVSLTQYQYFRGMDGDRASAGATKPPVHITDSNGTALPDSEPLTGFLREQVTYNGVGGAVVAGEIHDPWTRLTATQGTRQAFQVEAVRTATRTALASGGFRRGQLDTTFDNEGYPTQVNDLGDLTTAADDRCTRTDYARNEGGWLLNLPSRVSTVGVACGASPSYPADAISDVRTYYDGLAWDAAPTTGNVTRVEEAESYAGSTPRYVTISTATYDDYGRVLDSLDALQRRTTSRYAPETGPATTTTETNPEGHTVTTTLHPAWGLATSTVDANQARTDLAYDPLGRLTAVWEPDRPRATFPQQPSLRYGYGVLDNAPSWVRSEALKANGNYLTSFTLLDGFLRQRQTQVPSPKGGRVLNDTVYDSRGLTYLTRGPYYQETAPGATLVEPDINLVPSMTLTRFDGAERSTERIFLRFNEEPAGGRWRTSTEYGGDYLAVTPPTGESPFRTYTDARGQTIELRQYRGTTPSGDSFDATRYRYNKAGKLTQVTDPAGNGWRYEYDLRGRPLVMVDPDQGRTAMTYDAAGQLATTTDARGQTISYTYDDLGRKIETRSGSTVLATWTYDTLRAGLLTSSNRHQAGEAYTREFTGYDAAGRPTGERISFPGAEVGATGTVSFTTTMSYKVDGSLNLLRLPELAPDSPAETLTHTYDALGNLTNLRGNTQAGSTTYLNRATYTAFGEPELVELGDPAAGPHVWQQWTYEEGTRRLAKALTEREQAGNLLVDRLSYRYDPAGNLTAVKDELPGSAVDNQCFGYDYLRRMTEAWTQTGDCAASPGVGVAGPAAYWHSYRYDLTGNRTSLTRHGLGGAADTVSTYSYPDAGQPHPHAVQAVQTTGAGSGSYGYNATGDTVSRPGPGGQQTLVWDAETNLESITSGGSTTSYRYDADGAQLIRREPTTVTVFLGDSELVYDLVAKTRTGTRYYGVGDRPVAVRTGGALRWLVADHHGTNQLTIDPATLQASPRRFDPFGNPRGAAATWQGGNRGFVGGTRNDATGLTRLGAREYDPVIGRFISVDPVIDHNDPQQMNGYAYANNNPATMSDPDGRFLFFWMAFMQAVSNLIQALQEAADLAGYNQASKNCPPDRRCGSKRQQDAHDRQVTMTLPVLGRPLDPATVERWRSRWGYAGSESFTYGDAMEFAALGPEQANVVCQAMGGTVGDCQGRDTGPDLADLFGGVLEFIYDQTPIADVHHCIDGTESCWWIAANATGPLKYAAKGVDAARGGGRAAGNGDPPPVARGSNGGCSFSADTPVLMADGTAKPIEDVQPGDQLLATDPETGRQSAQAVTAVWVHDDTLVDLQILQGQAGLVPDLDAMVTITTTEDHPFWNRTDQQWQQAGSLDHGDELLAANGTAPTVVGLLGYTERRGSAYDLSVSDVHTYYVLTGDTPVLVHNCPAELPRLDSTGKVHGAVPSHLPSHWTVDQLEDLAVDLRISITVRKAEQARLGEDGPHRARIAQEERLLRQIEKTLGGS
jgi:RHS repeat-associated protein